MLMLAPGHQKPAVPSMWYCSPEAGSVIGRGLNCALAGAATTAQTTAAET